MSLWDSESASGDSKVEPITADHKFSSVQFIRQTTYLDLTW